MINTFYRIAKNRLEYSKANVSLPPESLFSLPESSRVLYKWSLEKYPVTKWSYLLFSAEERYCEKTI